MAVLFQIHVFSSILLVFLYVPFFLRAFLLGLLAKKNDNWCCLAGAIGIFLLLTANIWLGMLDLYTSNTLIAPFVNRNMQNNTITGTSSYWWTTPYLLPILCALFFAVRSVWPRLSGGFKLMTAAAAVFFVLSSNAVPWQWLGSLDNGVINLLQFLFGSLFLPRF